MKGVTIIILSLIIFVSCKNETIKNIPDNKQEDRVVFIDYPSPVEYSIRLLNADLIDTNLLLNTDFLKNSSIRDRFLNKNSSKIKGILHLHILISMAINDTLRVKEYFNEIKKTSNSNTELNNINRILNKYDNDSILFYLGNKAYKSYNKLDYEYQLSFIYEYIYHALNYFEETNYTKKTDYLSNVLDVKLTLNIYKNKITNNKSINAIIENMNKIYDYKPIISTEKNDKGNTILMNKNKYLFKQSDKKYFNNIYEIVKSERNNILE